MQPRSQVPRARALSGLLEGTAELEAQAPRLEIWSVAAKRRRMPDSERGKMLRGDAYPAADPGLTAERLRARRLLHRFNHADPADPARGSNRRSIATMARRSSSARESS